MALRSAGRKLSFDVLRLPDAQRDDISTIPSMYSRQQNHHQNLKKKRKKKSKKSTIHEEAVCNGEIISENSAISVEYTVTDCNVEITPENLFEGGISGEIVSENSFESGISVEEYANSVFQESLNGRGSDFPACSDAVEHILNPQLRQRNVNLVEANGGIEIAPETSEATSMAMTIQSEECKENASLKEDRELQQPQQPLLLSERLVETNVRRLEKNESLDWRKMITEDPHYANNVDKSPLGYFMEELHAGNSLSSTISLGNEKERQRVYDTIFHLPWRCELLIDVGYFVCLDSFLSLLTIMPTRIVMMVWRLLRTRQFKRPSAAEVADFGCFIVLASGVTLLQQADISLIYHMIRGQGTIKLYVVYNVLEIFDKLCQNFGGDVMQTLFSTTDSLVNSTPESLQYWLWRFIADEALAVAASIIHSFILLAQGITLSTCIVAHNNALFALLVSNNFAEIKSNVFKRFSKDNIHSMVYFDSVERFHISAFLLFVLAQNILEAEGPWFQNFIFNACVVFICEVMIDIIKHSFIAKFNDIKPIVFSEFLEDLCKQNLKLQAENGKKSLTFVPLAPACVVIRVLRPVFMAHLPIGPLPWRLFWVFLLSVMTFVMLTSLKLMIGMGLQKHATWYIKRCQKRKLHTD